MEQKINTIIFDLGNVLLDFDHNIAAKRIQKFSDKPPEEIFSLFFDSGITGIFEEGKISAQGFFLKVKEMLNLKIGYEEFLPIWNEIFILREKNLAVYNLARKLKSRYKLAVLSNINILHYEYIKNNFSLFDAFHKIITSCELGVRKPQAPIYHKALEILGTSAEQVFYTDDRPELVKEANQLGIKGFVFRGPQQLEIDLISAGIKINW